MKTKNGRKSAKKFLALFVACNFIFSNITWAAPLNLAAISSSDAQQSRDGIHILSLASQIEIPEAIGTVKTRFVADSLPGPRRDAGEKTLSPVIIHIQDAHSSYEAQINIKQILQHLTREYQVDTVFLEGAVNEIDPDLLRLFDEESLNQKLGNRLAKDGVVGGAELFLLEHTASANPLRVSVLGVENPQLYRKNLAAFREVMVQKEIAEQFLNQVKSTIVTLSSHVFNKALMAFFKEWLFYQDAPNEILRHLTVLKKYAGEVLKIDFSDPRAQLEWPQLVRVFKLEAFEKELNREKSDAEVQTLMAWIKEKGMSGKYAEGLKNIIAGKNFKASEFPEPRRFVERFYEEASGFGFSFANYPNLARALGFAILHNEIHAEELLEESNRLSDLLLEQMSEKEAGKALLSIYKDYLLLKKLWSLELVDEDYEKLLAEKEQIKPSQLAERLNVIQPNSKSEKSGGDKKWGADAAGDALFEKALGFYAGARERETEIFRRMTSRMDERKTAHAVLITGGFHTKGLAGLFKNKDISYVQVVPHITAIEGDNHYLELMTLKSGAMTKSSYVNLPRGMTDGGLLQMNRILPEYTRPYRARLLTGLAGVAVENGLPLPKFAAQLNQNPNALRQGISCDPATGVFLWNGAKDVSDGFVPVLSPAGLVYMPTDKALKNTVSNLGVALPARAEARGDDSAELAKIRREMAWIDRQYGYDGHEVGEEFVARLPEDVAERYEALSRRQSQIEARQRVSEESQTYHRPATDEEIGGLRQGIDAIEREVGLRNAASWVGEEIASYIRAHYPAYLADEYDRLNDELAIQERYRSDLHRSEMRGDETKKGLTRRSILTSSAIAVASGIGIGVGIFVTGSFRKMGRMEKEIQTELDRRKKENAIANGTAEPSSIEDPDQAILAYIKQLGSSDANVRAKALKELSADTRPEIQRTVIQNLVGAFNGTFRNEEKLLAGRKVLKETLISLMSQNQDLPEMADFTKGLAGDRRISGELREMAREALKRSLGLPAPVRQTPVEVKNTDELLSVIQGYLARLKSSDAQVRKTVLEELRNDNRAEIQRTVLQNLTGLNSDELKENYQRRPILRKTTISAMRENLQRPEVQEFVKALAEDTHPGIREASDLAKEALKSRAEMRSGQGKQGPRNKVSAKDEDHALEERTLLASFPLPDTTPALVGAPSLPNTLQVDYGSQMKAAAQESPIQPSSTLSPSDITALPGTPQIARVAPENNTSAVSFLPRGVQFAYNTNPGDWAGGGWSYDNYSTPAIETGNLSGFTQINVGLKGDIGTVKLEIGDNLEHKASVQLAGIRGDVEQVWAIPSTQFTGAGVDLSKVRGIYFIVEGPNQSGNLSAYDQPAAAVVKTATASNPGFSYAERTVTGGFPTVMYDIYQGSASVPVLSVLKSDYMGTYNGHSTRTIAVPDISPNGKYLAVTYSRDSFYTGYQGYPEQYVSVYDVTTGQYLRKIQLSPEKTHPYHPELGTGDPVQSARFIPENFYVVTYQSGKVAEYDPATGNAVAVAQGTPVVSNPEYSYVSRQVSQGQWNYDILKNGAVVASVSESMDVSGSQSIHMVPAVTGQGPDVSPNGQYLIVASKGTAQTAYQGPTAFQSVTVYDLQGNRLRTISLSVSRQLTDVRFTQADTIEVKDAAGADEQYDPETGTQIDGIVTVRTAASNSHYVFEYVGHNANTNVYLIDNSRPSAKILVSSGSDSRYAVTTADVSSDGQLMALGHHEFGPEIGSLADVALYRTSDLFAGDKTPAWTAGRANSEGVRFLTQAVVVGAELPGATYNQNGWDVVHHTFVLSLPQLESHGPVTPLELGSAITSVTSAASNSNYLFHTTMDSFGNVSLFLIDLSNPVAEKLVTSGSQIRYNPGLRDVSPDGKVTVVADHESGPVVGSLSDFVIYSTANLMQGNRTALARIGTANAQKIRFTNTQEIIEAEVRGPLYPQNGSDTEYRYYVYTTNDLLANPAGYVPQIWIRAVSNHDFGFKAQPSTSVAFQGTSVLAYRLDTFTPVGTPIYANVSSNSETIRAIVSADVSPNEKYAVEVITYTNSTMPITEQRLVVQTLPPFRSGHLYEDDREIRLPDVQIVSGGFNANNTYTVKDKYGQTYTYLEPSVPAGWTKATLSSDYAYKITRYTDNVGMMRSKLETYNLLTGEIKLIAEVSQGTDFTGEANVIANTGYVVYELQSSRDGQHEIWLRDMNNPNDVNKIITVPGVDRRSVDNVTAAGNMVSIHVTAYVTQSPSTTKPAGVFRVDLTTRTVQFVPDVTTPERINVIVTHGAAQDGISVTNSAGQLVPVLNLPGFVDRVDAFQDGLLVADLSARTPGGARVQVYRNFVNAGVNQQPAYNFTDIVAVSEVTRTANGALILRGTSSSQDRQQKNITYTILGTQVTRQEENFTAIAAGGQSLAVELPALLHIPTGALQTYVAAPYGDTWTSNIEALPNLLIAHATTADTGFGLVLDQKGTPISAMSRMVMHVTSTNPDLRIEIVTQPSGIYEKKDSVYVHLNPNIKTPQTVVIPMSAFKHLTTEDLAKATSIFLINPDIPAATLVAEAGPVSPKMVSYQTVGPNTFFTTEDRIDHLWDTSMNKILNGVTSGSYHEFVAFDRTFNGNHLVRVYDTRTGGQVKYFDANSYGTNGFGAVSPTGQYALIGTAGAGVYEVNLLNLNAPNAYRRIGIPAGFASVVSAEFPNNTVSVLTTSDHEKWTLDLATGVVQKGSFLEQLTAFKSSVSQFPGVPGPVDVVTVNDRSGQKIFEKTYPLNTVDKVYAYPDVLILDRSTAAPAALHVPKGARVEVYPNFLTAMGEPLVLQGVAVTGVSRSTNGNLSVRVTSANERQEVTYTIANGKVIATKIHVFPVIEPVSGQVVSALSLARLPNGEPLVYRAALPADTGTWNHVVLSNTVFGRSSGPDTGLGLVFGDNKNQTPVAVDLSHTASIVVSAASTNPYVRIELVTQDAWPRETNGSVVLHVTPTLRNYKIPVSAFGLSAQELQNTRYLFEINAGTAPATMAIQAGPSTHRVVSVSPAINKVFYTLENGMAYMLDHKQSGKVYAGVLSQAYQRFAYYGTNAANAPYVFVYSTKTEALVAQYPVTNNRGTNGFTAKSPRERYALIGTQASGVYAVNLRNPNARNAFAWIPLPVSAGKTASVASAQFLTETRVLLTTTDHETFTVNLRTGKATLRTEWVDHVLSNSRSLLSPVSLLGKSLRTATPVSVRDQIFATGLDTIFKGLELPEIFPSLLKPILGPKNVKRSELRVTNQETLGQYFSQIYGVRLDSAAEVYNVARQTVSLTLPQDVARVFLDVFAPEKNEAALVQSRESNPALAAAREALGEEYAWLIGKRTGAPSIGLIVPVSKDTNPNANDLGLLLPVIMYPGDHFRFAMAGMNPEEANHFGEVIMNLARKIKLEDLSARVKVAPSGTSDKEIARAVQRFAGEKILTTTRRGVPSARMELLSQIEHRGAALLLSPAKLKQVVVLMIAAAFLRDNPPESFQIQVLEQWMTEKGINMATLTERVSRMMEALERITASA